MKLQERLARIGDRLFDRLRDKRAFAITYEEASTGGFDGLRGHKYAVLVTFRRNGEAVPSPVWFGIDQGRVYVQSARHLGKVKRVERDGRVVIAASNVRGKPIGPALRGTARVLPAEEQAHAEKVVAAAYGVGRRMYMGTLSAADDTNAYIEISPTG